MPVNKNKKVITRVDSKIKLQKKEAVYRKKKQTQTEVKRGRQKIKIVGRLKTIDISWLAVWMEKRNIERQKWKTKRQNKIVGCSHKKKATFNVQKQAM